MSAAGRGPADGGSPPGDPERRLGLVGLRTLGFGAAAGVIAGLVLVVVSERLAGHPPVLPWTGPAALLFVAVALGVTAFLTWRRIQVQREQVDPERAVLLLALGKASAIGGAAIAGGYLVFAAMSVGNLAAAGPQQRVVRGLVAAVAGVGISVAGLWLERACRVPDPTDPDDEDDPIQE